MYNQICTEINVYCHYCVLYIQYVDIGTTPVDRRLSNVKYPIYNRVEWFWIVLYVVPNCCWTPIPKFHVLMLPLSLVARPLKIWAVTLKWEEKNVFITFLKVAPATKYVFSCLKAKTEEKPAKKIVFLCTDQKTFWPF